MAEQSRGEWLRQFRESRDLTQAAFAEQVGVSDTTIKKVEGNKQRLTCNLRTRMLKAFDCSPEEAALLNHFAPVPRSAPSTQQRDSVPTNSALADEEHAAAQFVASSCLAAFLSLYRRSRGRSQSDLARFFELTPDMIRAIEHGRRALSKDTAERIAKKLGFDTHQIQAFIEFAVVPPQPPPVAITLSDAQQWPIAVFEAFDTRWISNWRGFTNSDHARTVTREFVEGRYTAAIESRIAQGSTMICDSLIYGPKTFLAEVEVEKLAGDELGRVWSDVRRGE